MVFLIVAGLAIFIASESIRSYTKAAEAERSQLADAPATISGGKIITTGGTTGGKEGQDKCTQLIQEAKDKKQNVGGGETTLEKNKYTVEESRCVSGIYDGGEGEN